MHKNLILAAATLVAAGSLRAQYFEARNFAMGGAGTASSHYLAAGWANPALLTRHDESDDFGVLLPVVGAAANDKTGLLEDLNDFVDEYDRLEQSGGSPSEFLALADQLQALGGRNLTANVGLGFAVAVPGQSLGWSLHLRSYADLQASVDIDPADIAALQGGTLPANFNSEARLIGVGISEVGLSLATRFDLGGIGLSVGVTPKYQRVDTYNYSVNVNNFDVDNYDDDQYRNDDGRFNLDAGVAVEPGAGLTFGLVVRNFFEETYTTETIFGESYDYEVGPQATIGAAWSVGWLTATADADLLSVERFKTSPSLPNKDDIQLVRLGAELDLASWIQLRGGYITDLEDSIDPTITGGLGLSPFGVLHIDLAGSYVDEQSYGGAVQLALTF